LRIDRALHARISNDFRDEYLRLENWSLFPDTIAALEHASRSRCISVVLSNNIPELPEIAAALGIKGFFRHIFVSAKIGYEKPDARAFHIALDGVKEKGNVWVIGDSYAADIRGALHAGLKAVLVRREHPKAIYFTPGLEGIWKFMTR
jgi:putative hydrolase of the HAD superfamily